MPAPADERGWEPAKCGVVREGGKQEAATAPQVDMRQDLGASVPATPVIKAGQRQNAAKQVVRQGIDAILVRHERLAGGVAACAAGRAAGGEQRRALGRLGADRAALARS